MGRAWVVKWHPGTERQRLAAWSVRLFHSVCAAPAPSSACSGALQRLRTGRKSSLTHAYIYRTRSKLKARTRARTHILYTHAREASTRVRNFDYLQCSLLGAGKLTCGAFDLAAFVERALLTAWPTRRAHCSPRASLRAAKCSCWSCGCGCSHRAMRLRRADLWICCPVCCCRASCPECRASSNWRRIWSNKFSGAAAWNSIEPLSCWMLCLLVSVAFVRRAEPPAMSRSFFAFAQQQLLLLLMTH